MTVSRSSPASSSLFMISTRDTRGTLTRVTWKPSAVNSDDPLNSTLTDDDDDDDDMVDERSIGEECVVQEWNSCLSPDVIVR